jgi:Uri superfamily endonuclease
MALKSEAAIVVGRLGCSGGKGGESEITFPAGYYVYFGSARAGLSARVGRHLKREKRFHWHIDYLLQFAEVVEVWYSPDGAQVEWGERKKEVEWGVRKKECLWCQVARGMPQGQILIPGFGSSDCRCPAHLIYFPSPPSFELFRRMLEERGYGAIKASPIDFKRRMVD